MGAVVVGADLLAALGLRALAVLALHVFIIFDQIGTVRAVAKGAGLLLRGKRKRTAPSG